MTRAAVIYAIRLPPASDIRPPFEAVQRVALVAGGRVVAPPCGTPSEIEQRQSAHLRSRAEWRV